MATAKPAEQIANDGDLAPLLAGAHARGMFDALELMGQGAILLDREGRALAVTRSAQPWFGATLAIAQGCPVSAERDDDSRLRGAILAALAGSPGEISIGPAGEEMTLRLSPVAGPAHQLLAAILLIRPAALGVPSASEARAAPARPIYWRSCGPSSRFGLKSC